MTEPNGEVWHNIVTLEVAMVAETLRELRGSYRYDQLDPSAASMCSPGAAGGPGRRTCRSPIVDRRAHGGDDGFTRARIYRKVSRGPHLGS